MTFVEMKGSFLIDAKTKDGMKLIIERLDNIEQG